MLPMAALKEENNDSMKILFTGGGTLGSVSPLLAIYEELQTRGALKPADALWIGTRKGPEQNLVVGQGIRFTAIAAGKLRRYIHWRNLIDPILMIGGFIQACFIIGRFRPTVMLNAGSYVGLPVAYASRCFGVPIIILQLDIEPTRSNLLCAHMARYVGVSLPEIARFFPREKTRVVGIPVRASVSIHSRSVQGRPTVLVTGGGTGAEALNMLVTKSLHIITHHAELVHMTGKNKEGASSVYAQRDPHYHPIAFSEDMATVMARADIIVTRAGMGTLAELSAMRKPTIIIPIPHSHQEKNALYFQDRDAAIVLRQEELTPEIFAETVIDLLHNDHRKHMLGTAIGRIFPSRASAHVADIISQL